MPIRICYNASRQKDTSVHDGTAPQRSQLWGFSIPFWVGGCELLRGKFINIKTPWKIA